MEPAVWSWACILLACFLLAVVPTSGTVPEMQRNALMDLYNSTQGAAWRYKWNWGTGDPCTLNWYGIDCDCPGKSHINGVNLWENNLDGTLPSTIGQLTQLLYLHLWSNALHGTIPSEVGTISTLLHLYVNSNMMRGELPSEVGNLASLEHLFLSNNYFTGKIPDSFKNLTKTVDYAAFQYNALTGPLPDFVCAFSNADFRQNYFECPAPKCCITSSNPALHCQECWNP
tara:strand:+ start:3081 stop:3767 length:687 start_codon:yes stop_codon:yes gene_type:complete